MTTIQEHRQGNSVIFYFQQSIPCTDTIDYNETNPDNLNISYFGKPSHDIIECDVDDAEYEARQNTEIATLDGILYESEPYKFIGGMTAYTRYRIAVIKFVEGPNLQSKIDSLLPKVLAEMPSIRKTARALPRSYAYTNSFSLQSLNPIPMLRDIGLVQSLFGEPGMIDGDDFEKKVTTVKQQLLLDLTEKERQRRKDEGEKIQQLAKKIVHKPTLLSETLLLYRHCTDQVAQNQAALESERQNTLQALRLTQRTLLLLQPIILAALRASHAAQRAHQALLNKLHALTGNQTAFTNFLSRTRTVFQNILALNSQTSDKNARQTIENQATQGINITNGNR